MTKHKWKQPRKKNTLRTARILDRKFQRLIRQEWYIERKEGKHKGPCPL